MRSGSFASSTVFLLADAHDFLLFRWFVRRIHSISSGRCSRFPAFSLIRPLLPRVFFWPVPMISCFFSDSSASPAVFLLDDAHDFLLFRWFVRFSRGFSSGRCSRFPVFSLVRPLLPRVFFWPVLTISYFFSDSSAAFRNRSSVSF